MGLEPDEYKVNIASDKMEATITLLSKEGGEQPEEAEKTEETEEAEKAEEKIITVDDLRGALTANKVTTGIDEEQLASLAEKPDFNQPYIVAHGATSKDGDHGSVDYKFPTEDTLDLEEDESGSIDFRNIGNFNNTRKGELLATQVAPTNGEPGVNVIGDELKARDGKAVALRVGKGVAVSEDGTSATADVDGHACLVGDRISVLNTVETPTHVDYSIGNISFIGNVVVKGSVRPEFKVEAKGSIEIAGNVEQAEITSGGDLTIHGNVFGQSDTRIKASGDAAIGAIDQAELSVRGNLSVKNYIRHSQVSVGGSIEVTGDKGNIVGGDVHSFRGIQVPFVGNSMAALTKLTVGTNPLISHEIEEIQEQLDELTGKLKQVEQAISMLADRRLAAGGQLDPKSQAMLDKLQVAQQQLEPQIKTLKEQLVESESKSVEFKAAKIRVKETIYPGVVISFRDRMQYKTQDELQCVAFFEENAEIGTGPY